MAGVTTTKTQAYHGTLVAATVDTVTISGQFRKFAIINRSGTSEINFTYASSGSAPPAATVAGDNTMVLTAGVGAVQELDFEQGVKNLQVSLISAGTPTYSVVGLTN